MAKVLVLDGHNSAALAFTRSLGRVGHWVCVGTTCGSARLASYSRYCQKHLQYYSPLKNVHRFIVDVCRFTETNRIDLVIPCSEGSLWPVSRFRDEFADVCKLAIPDHTVVEAASDKANTTTLAERAGATVAPFAIVRKLEHMANWSQVSLPAVVKSRQSLQWVSSRAVGSSVEFAYRLSQLREIIGRRLESSEELIVQEYFGGCGAGVAGFAIKGKLLAPFQWMRIREKDPRGSGSSASKSVALSESALRATREIVNMLSFTGLIMVEFKQTADEFCFMEVNARPWGSMQLAIHCGIDFPRICADWHLNQIHPPQTVEYRQGILCRGAVAELTHLENVWEGKPEGWPGEFPSFMSTVLKVLLPWSPRMRYDHLSLWDPQPGVRELLAWGRAKLSSL